MQGSVLYIDTNSFIQLRDLKDLPWRELLPGVTQVNLVVARVVVEELDRHKTGTNRRLRDRARAALGLIDAASEAPDRSIVLRETPVRVVLSIAPRRTLDYEALSLDRAEPDDRLVAATSAHDGAALLSHDSGPRITARDIGLRAYAPPETWLLPAEQSDEQRRLADAERRIKALQDARPDVSITFTGAIDGVVALSCLVLPPLAADTVKRLVGRLRLTTEKAELPRAGTGRHAQMLLVAGAAYSDRDVQQYEEAFAEWERKIVVWAGRLHELVSRRLLAAELRFNLLNTGIASAERLVVDIDAEPGIFMVADDEAARELLGSLRPPVPPEAPEGRPFADFSALSRSMQMPTSLDPAQSDPTHLTWIVRPEAGSREATYGCVDFRPGREFADRLLIGPSDINPTATRFSVTASANHMSARSESVIVRFDAVEVEWSDPRVVAVLPDDIARSIEAHAG